MYTRIETALKRSNNKASFKFFLMQTVIEKFI